MSLAERSRDFMRIARSIGKDIANTYTKLEKLTLLAKRKTIAFDDRPAEIQNLTFIIKEDMNQLNRQIGQVNIEFSYIYSLSSQLDLQTSIVSLLNNSKSYCSCGK